MATVSFPNEETRPLSSYNIVQEQTLPLLASESRSALSDVTVPRFVPITPAPFAPIIPITPAPFVPLLPIQPEHNNFLPPGPSEASPRIFNAETPIGQKMRSDRHVTTARQRKLAMFMISSAIVLLILAIGGLSAIIVITQHRTPAIQSASNIAPASFTSTVGPSRHKTISQAADTVFRPQTTAQIDNNDQPTRVANTFITGQKVYITFEIASNGHKGFIEAKWYRDNQLINTSNFAHDPLNSVGTFSIIYNEPAQGTVELYWCTKSNCSDAALAQVVTFTVIAASTTTNMSAIIVNTPLTSFRMI